LPNVDQRRDQALREVARIRQQQDEISRQVDQARQQAPNDPKAREQLAQKLTEAARKQADAAEALSKMDAPNQEARQQRTEDALNRAMDDLLANRKEDVEASQQDAKRQLQRLEQALRGQKPADELAAELAKRQKDLADE